ncbi:hypothetical protein [Niabella drilacis]|uniref:Lipoprotein n=1 Tax=Niabella drilacis (strain DSM 25811 / CCM 8410 / CCUG 62505 / LMG 26954 / E90) TaxID=1285928 RepID=A0A1G6TC67_NIADE|nr:hypothetical protein [Niabella drilacis]SDD26688.1 hypothetical protein SAMN04487894_107168 [Niabella drilacis]
MKRVTVLFLISGFFLLSCGGRMQNETTAAPPKTEPATKDTLRSDTGEAVSIAETRLPGSLPQRNFPIKDSTSFDNFEQTGIADNGFLKRIKFNPGHLDARNFRLNYTVPFSENFSSVVVTYQSGEHELFTTLITLSKEDTIIDRLEIAYDEIAESAFGKSSSIEKDKITVTDWNWMSEEKPVSESKTYVLQQDGKFKILPSAGNK